MRSLKSRYEITKILGEGGMGVVYRAIDRQMGREVAVKTIRDVSDGSALAPFHREATLLSSLNHPNIVDIYDIGEFEDHGTKTPYFVMPLLPGAPLSALMTSQAQRLTPERIVEIMLQALRGLQAAHEKGIVHRDLKPSNIFVLDDDSVKIIDFGISHFMGHQSTIALKGTLFYMAPEQLDMQTSTALSDIFSIGVICYETMTRRRPFVGATNEELVQAIRTSVPPPASELNPAVNSLLAQIIHAAMAKLPWHRVSSAREFGEYLQRALRNQSIERFDPAKIEVRLQKARTALANSEYDFAGEILTELEAEGHVHPEMPQLRKQIDQANRSRAVRRLLRSAECRLKDDEYQLALEKLHQVLQIDPHHPDALRLKSDVESKRSTQQVDKWLQLAADHLHNCSFSHARQAVQKVMEIKPGDTHALHLLESVERSEQKHLANVREKEHHYQSAIECWKRGEVTSALKQVEKLMALDREYPEQSYPEKTAAYQELYNTVRSEHEGLKADYDEAKSCLATSNLAAGLAICEKRLEAYPNHVLFESLQLDLIEAQRQTLSAFIAKIDRDVQAELDLDRKVSILEAALRTQPNEPHFQQALRAVTARREQINAIVSRAQNLEDRGQYADALNEWETLQTIYHLYPGLEYEIERVTRRNQFQALANRKTRFIEQVEAAIQSGDYHSALSIFTAAHSEFPDDAELASLEKLAHDGVERQQRAEDLIAGAKNLLGEDRFQDALSRFEEAHALSGGSPSSRVALLEALLNRASALVPSDLDNAETLVQRATMLDGGNPQAKSLRLLIGDRKRESIVERALSSARQFQAEANVKAATAELSEALKAFPSDARLLKLKDALQQSHPESGPLREQRERGDCNSLRADHSLAEPFPATGQFRATRVLGSGNEHERNTLPPVRARNVAGSPPASLIAYTFGFSSLLKTLPLWSMAIAFALLLLPAALFIFKTHHSSNSRPVAAVGSGYGIVSHKADLAGKSAQTQTDATYAPPSNNIGSTRINSANDEGTQSDLSSQSSLPDERVSAAKQNGTVIVRFSPPDSTLTINGHPMKPAKSTAGTSVFSLAPNAYKIKATHPAYQDLPEQSVELPKGQTKSLTFRLVRLSSLSLAKFPADTRVWMDGESIGVTAADGHLDTKVSLGAHTFAFQKNGYDDVSVKREISANPTTLLGSEILTSRPGKLTFKAIPASARITVHLEGTGSVIGARNGQTVPLRPGLYDIQVDADHYQTKKETVVLQGGEAKLLDFALLAVAPPTPKALTIATVFQDPHQWIDDQGWWRHISEGPGWFANSAGNFTITFLKPAQKIIFPFKPKRTQCLVDSQSNGDGLVYSLDSKVLQRLVKSGSKTSDGKAIHHGQDAKTITIELEISPKQVIVRGPDGKLLDEYQRPKPDAPLGKFGVFGDASLTVTNIH